MSVGYFFAWCIAYLPIRLLYPTTVINKKVFRQKGRAVMVCNHMSNLDVVIIKSHEHTKRYVLAKHSLFKNKFVGGVLKGLGGIPVNRQEVGVSTIRSVLDVLKNENQVLIFPEGTRETSIDDVNALKNGMAMFALKSESPIIPMMLLYKPKMFRFNKLIVGEPIDLSQYKGQRVSKDAYAEIANNVLNTMQNLRKDYINSLKPRRRAKVLAKLEKIEQKEQEHLQRKAEKVQKKIDRKHKKADSV